MLEKNKKDKIKEMMKEADETIYKLENNLNNEKKNVEILNKKCIEYENKIKKLNDNLVDAENDNYDKNNELKIIKQSLIDLNNLNKSLKKENSILIDNINNYKYKICDLENELNISQILLNNLNDINIDLEKKCIYLDSNYNNDCEIDTEDRNKISLYDEIINIKDSDSFFSFSNEDFNDVSIQVDFDNLEIDDLKKINKCKQIQIIALRFFNFSYLGIIVYLLYENIYK